MPISVVAIVPGVKFSAGALLTVNALLRVTVSVPLEVGVVTVMLYVPAAVAGFIVSGTLRLVGVDVCTCPGCTKGSAAAVVANTATFGVADVEPGVATRVKLTLLPVPK